MIFGSSGRNKTKYRIKNTLRNGLLSRKFGEAKNSIFSCQINTFHEKFSRPTITCKVGQSRLLG